MSLYFYLLTLPANRDNLHYNSKIPGDSGHPHLGDFEFIRKIKAGFARHYNRFHNRRDDFGENGSKA